MSRHANVLETPARAETVPWTDQASRLRRLVEQGGLPATHESGAATEPSPSVPSGAVSFRPRSRPQGSRRAPASARPVRLARAIAITSGKGGVGKSNLAMNLAVTLSGLGRKVCLLDADLGLANLDVLCNLTPKLTLQHVIAGRCRLVDVVLLAPGGVRLLPGASGVPGMADLGPRQRVHVFEQLRALERVADDLIIDCAAGISANVLAFAAAAHTTVVTTTPEPTAVTDAYGMVKNLIRHRPDAQIRLVVNMTGDGAGEATRRDPFGHEEARGIHERMNRVCRTFLGRTIDYGGAVPLDPAVSAAVRHRLPFTLLAPDAPATHAVGGIARDLAGLDEHDDDPPSRGGFFARMASLWRRPDGRDDGPPVAGHAHPARPARPGRSARSRPSGQNERTTGP